VTTRNEESYERNGVDTVLVNEKGGPGKSGNYADI